MSKEPDTLWSPLKLFSTLIIALFLSSIFVSALVVEEIEKSGGVKQIIINVGKDVKDIIKEINKEE